MLREAEVLFSQGQRLEKRIRGHARRSGRASERAWAGEMALPFFFRILL